MAWTGTDGRVKRGLKPGVCKACQWGVSPFKPKTFDPRCEGCVAKRTRYFARLSCPCKQNPECSKCTDDRMLGLRTGAEPPPSDRGDYEDKPYLAWLRLQPCRVPGCHGKAIPHHLRHDANGAALGAHVKDDRRAISLCDRHHTGDVGIHTVPWILRLELAVDDLKAWQDQQLEAQRVEYLRRLAAA